MLIEARYRGGMHIACQADFQRDSFVENVLSQCAHAQNIAILDFHVFDQPRGMADTMGSAPLDRLPDGFLAEAFARMDRDVEVFTLNVMESVDMFLRRISAFFSREIETDNSMRREVDRNLRNLL